MENTQRSGTCAYCHEESDRLFMPPLISPPDWSLVRRDGNSAWWHCAGQPSPGESLYDVVVDIGGEYLKPSETPDKPICWECFDGHVLPAVLPFVINKPSQIQFNGFEPPVWVGAASDKPMTVGDLRQAIEGVEDDLPVFFRRIAPVAGNIERAGKANFDQYSSFGIVYDCLIIEPICDEG